MIAASAPPTACPVVPPGSGTLNIMMTKEKAANRAISGTLRADIRSRRLRALRAQNGNTSKNMITAVRGLR